MNARPVILDGRDRKLLHAIQAQGGKVFVTRQGGNANTTTLMLAAEATSADELCELLQRLDDFALVERDASYTVAFVGEITQAGLELIESES